MTFLSLLAIFSGLIAVITTFLVPFAYFGDKNEKWTKRLLITAALSATIFLIDLLHLIGI
jgi:hypothetical protein